MYCQCFKTVPNCVTPHNVSYWTVSPQAWIHLRWLYEILPATKFAIWMHAWAMKVLTRCQEGNSASFKPHAKILIARQIPWLVGMFCRTPLWVLIALAQRRQEAVNLIDTTKLARLPCLPTNKKTTLLTVWITACQLCSIHLHLTRFPCSSQTRHKDLHMPRASCKELCVFFQLGQKGGVMSCRGVSFDLGGQWSNRDNKTRFRSARASLCSGSQCTSPVGSCWENAPGSFALGRCPS